MAQVTTPTVAEAPAAEPAAATPAPSRLSPRALGLGVCAVVVAFVVGMAVGPVSISPLRVFAELVDMLPFVDVDSGLSDTQAAIVRELRLPRVVLAMLVGALLASSGVAYQGVFRNPLADPYLLGIGAGAGLGATLAIVSGVSTGGGVVDPLPLAAFGGALLAVAATLVVGSAAGRFGSAATLILAGVAVAAFFTAVQTYVWQRESENLRQIYSWILGRLSTAGWGEVALIAPYAAVTAVALIAFRGHLDVLAVGDDEATTLGMNPRRVRITVVTFASLAAAAAVAVSGLIGFVGLIVPHAVRLIAGVSHRVLVPLSLLFGGAFLALADLLARTIQSPAELPIGVVTAFFGAPFFLLILRSRARSLS